MELAEAEEAALKSRPETSRAVLDLADVDEPRDPFEEREHQTKEQFAALASFSRERGCRLTRRDIPPESALATPGREVTVFQEPWSQRVWKSTFPDQAGCGPFGFFTPAGYLQRLQLSNKIFADDVQFEGTWRRRDGLSIVTSQPFIQPHPGRFIPTEIEIADYLTSLDFYYDKSSCFWIRDSDSIQLGDTHDRNFIRTPDESIIAIDVQPREIPRTK